MFFQSVLFDFILIFYFSPTRSSAPILFATKDVLCRRQEPIFDGKNGSTKKLLIFILLKCTAIIICIFYFSPARANVPILFATKDVLCGRQEPIFDGKNGSTKNQQHSVVSFGEAIPRTRLSLRLRS